MTASGALCRTRRSRRPITRDHRSLQVRSSPDVAELSFGRPLELLLRHYTLLLRCLDVYHGKVEIPLAQDQV